MVRVKICGITNQKDALAAIAMGADSLGFHVELEGSKCPIGAATASSIIAKLPPYVSSVIVTTETDPKSIIRLAKATWANTFQLHGDVTADTVRAVKAVMPYLKIYAVVHVFGADAIDDAKKFEDAADAVILDSKDVATGARGGTGKTHDWNISKRVVEALTLPVILAGGLNPENVEEAIRIVKPYAVDVESGISNPDCTKDLEKMKLFIQLVKKT